MREETKHCPDQERGGPGVGTREAVAHRPSPLSRSPAFYRAFYRCSLFRSPSSAPVQRLLDVYPYLIFLSSSNSRNLSVLYTRPEQLLLLPLTLPPLTVGTLNTLARSGECANINVFLPATVEESGEPQESLAIGKLAIDSSPQSGGSPSFSCTSRNPVMMG